MSRRIRDNQKSPEERRRIKTMMDRKIEENNLKYRPVLNALGVKGYVHGLIKVGVATKQEKEKYGIPKNEKVMFIKASNMNTDDAFMGRNPYLLKNAWKGTRYIHGQDYATHYYKMPENVTPKEINKMNKSKTLDYVKPMLERGY